MKNKENFSAQNGPSFEEFQETWKQMHQHFERKDSDLPTYETEGETSLDSSSSGTLHPTEVLSSERKKISFSDSPLGVEIEKDILEEKSEKVEVNENMQNNLSLHDVQEELPIQEKNAPATILPPSRSVSWEQSQEVKQEKKMKSSLRVSTLALVLVCSLCTATAGGFIGSAFTHAYYQSSPHQSILPPPVHTQMNKEAGDTGAANMILKDSQGQSIYTPKQIAALAAPAVVYVKTQAEVVNIFGQRAKVEGAGSGVLLRPDGYIATNNHVVANASAVEVRLSNGKEYKATVVGTDKNTDLAVIKIEANHDESFPYLQLADSSKASVGDQVVAIGNPLGEFEGSLTVGYVSALDRSITVQNEDGTRTTLVGLLQTDAAINRGNSGGALINEKGELLGINSVKTSAVGVEGLGFAIPSNTVKPIIEDLIQYGKIRDRVYLGISGLGISEEIRQTYGLPAGIWIKEVLPNSPASKAGLVPEDILLKINGTAVGTVEAINALKSTMKLGEAVELEVYRHGETLKLTLIPEASPNN